MVRLRSEKKLNCSHIQNSSGRQEPLAETPKPQVRLDPSKLDWIPGYILPRSLWCEVTSPHSPSSHLQIFYPQIIWCFQHETQGPVLFWTWAISSGTSRHVTSTTVGAHCWVGAAGSCCQSLLIPTSPGKSRCFLCLLLTSEARQRQVWNNLITDPALLYDGWHQLCEKLAFQ